MHTKNATIPQNAAGKHQQDTVRLRQKPNVLTGETILWQHRKKIKLKGK